METANGPSYDHQPAQRPVPQPATNNLPRTAGSRPHLRPTKAAPPPPPPVPSPSLVPADGKAPQRVVVSSKKVAPTSQRVREERERQQREAEHTALSAQLRFTRPNTSTATAATPHCPIGGGVSSGRRLSGGSGRSSTGPHPCSLPRADGSSAGNSPVGKPRDSGFIAEAKPGSGDDEDDDEDESYYVVHDRPEVSVEERVEAVRKVHEERVEEKHMELRRRQGIARRPKSLLRSRYGQLKTIGNGRGDAGERPGEDDSGEPLKLLAEKGPSRGGGGSGDSDHDGGEYHYQRGDDAVEKEEPVVQPRPVYQLVHPSPQLDIDLDDEDDDNCDNGRD